MNWVSQGRKIDTEFLRWLRYHPTIILPNLSNKLLPPVSLRGKTKLVTIHWENSRNFNRILFPDVKIIETVGYTEFPSDSGATITCDPTYKYYINNTIRWTEDEWVNEEWLTSQYNEFFAKCQQFYQNELRNRLR